MRSKLMMMFMLFSWLMSGLFIAADVPEREQHETECRENLRIIGKALKAYRRDHNDRMPDWLSDLYPEYLQDPRIILCPADGKGSPPGTWETYKDPKMPCSYTYQFNPMKFTFGVAGFEHNPPKEPTFKEAKTIEMKYYGGLVPSARCRHHGGRIIDLSYDERLYISEGSWTDTQEAIKTALSFFKNAVDKNPDGWEKEFSVMGMYKYFHDRRRLPAYR